MSNSTTPKKPLTPELLISLRAPVKSDYENGQCPHCEEEIPDDLLRGGNCTICDAVLYDLFEFYDSQPFELRAITVRYDDLFEAGEIGAHILCEEMLKEVSALGFTFDYELDFQPLALRVAE